MKKYLILAGIAATFFACSDDSSSTSGSDDLVMSGTITVDDKNQTAVTVLSNSATLCINENLGYTWKNIDLGEERDSIKYEFVGDTLVIYDDYDDYDEEFSTYGEMYVGGSAGKLDGTWHSTLCEYNSERKTSSCRTLCSEIQSIDSDLMKAFEDLIRLSCVEDDEVTKVTVKISGSSIKTIVEYPESSYDKEYFDDYMNSEFMYDFYRNLKNEYSSIPSVSDLKYDDSSSIAELVEDSVISIVTQTKNSATFIFKEQTLSVKVGQFVRSEESEKVSLDISYNGKTCSLVQESGYVTKSTCKAEYGEYFDKTSVKDAEGNIYTAAVDYSKSNRSEFSNCAEDLLDSVFAAVDRLKKASGEDEDEDDDNDLDECEAIYSTYIDCAYQGYSNCSKYLEQYYDCLSLDIAPSYSTSTDFIPKKDFLKRQQSLTNKLLKLSN